MSKEELRKHSIKIIRPSTLIEILCCKGFTEEDAEKFIYEVLKTYSFFEYDKDFKSSATFQTSKLKEKKR